MIYRLKAAVFSSPPSEYRHRERRNFLLSFYSAEPFSWLSLTSPVMREQCPHGDFVQCGIVSSKFSYSICYSASLQGSGVTPLLPVTALLSAWLKNSRAWISGSPSPATSLLFLHLISPLFPSLCFCCVWFSSSLPWHVLHCVCPLKLWLSSLSCSSAII